MIKYVPDTQASIQYKYVSDISVYLIQICITIYLKQVCS